MPSWYADIKVAQYLGCKVWELWEHPSWAARGEVAMLAELGAKKATKERETF